MKDISKDRVLAAIVRTFFKYFVTGIIESQSDTGLQQRFEPAYIKKTMLRHYEHISRHFNQEVFFSLMRLNFSEDEFELKLRDFMKPGTTDMELVRFACRTEELYQTMVSEYKRNFELLLCGRFETQEEHEASYTRLPEPGFTGIRLAENIIGQLAANAYARGKETGNS